MTIERKIEAAYGYQPGTVIIYCPGKTHLKEADCLVTVDNASRIKKVKDLKTQAGFETFGEQAEALQAKYASLWNLYVFVPERLQFFEHPFEKDFIRAYEESKEPSTLAIEQDADMKIYLEQNPDAKELHNLYEKYLDAEGLDTFRGIVKQEETKQEALAERNLNLDSLFGFSYQKRVINSLKEKLTQRQHGRNL